MYLVFHGDHEDMVFGEPQFFDSRDEAVAWAEKRFAGGIPRGHAITVYQCTETRTFAASESAT